MSCVCLAATIWAITEGMLYLGFDIETSMLITKVQYFGIAALPPFALLFGLSIFGLESWISRVIRLALFIIAVTIVLLVWTNPLHRLIFTEYYPIQTGPFPMLGLKHGSMWWAIILYHYFLVAVLSIILVRQVVTSSGYYRSQAGIMVVAVVFVWLSNAVYVSGKSPVPNMDISPIAFVLVAGAMAWGFYRYRLLDILPVAKTKIFQSLDDIILVTDKENRILDLNRVAESVFKVKASQIIGQEAVKAFNKFPQFSKVFAEKASTEIYLNPDGPEQVYDLRVSFITDKNGSMLGKTIVLRDITDKKKAEESLKQSEERYRSLIENTMEGYFICDLPSGQFLFLNERSCDIYGYTPAEGLKLTIWDVISSEEHERVEKRVQDRLEGKKLSSERQTYTSVHKDGSSIRVEISTSLITFQGRPVVQGVIRDVTEQERLEQQLQQSKKMEAIGLLAAGVAHDLNNVLSGIVSYPDLLLMDLPEDSPLIKPIQTIHNSGKKAAEIVQDLLTLARRGVSNKDILNLNDVILAFLKSAEHEKLISHHSNVSVETFLDKNILNIKGSSTLLIKMIMNLVSNAAEAQPTGGQITISTRNQYVDTPIKGYEEIKEGDFVVLEIKDTGLGIAAQDLNRIFEPFYTKKVMGRSGTGLGMAVVWGTIHDHDGHVDVKSVEGVGTTFSLFFPVKRDKKIMKKEFIPVEEYLGKKETILVVDDIMEQREIAATILAKLNYAVTTVSSGEDAVTYLKDNSADLLILDMIMEPGIDGLETYRRIKKLHPNQKAIIASGYSETERVKEAQKLGVSKYIRKPYTLEKIGLAVKDELRK